LFDKLAEIKKVDTNTSGFQQKRKMRIRWVESLIDLGLSPLEHKWVIRIVLQKLDIGLGYQSILTFYHPWAMDLYNSNKTLKTLCAKIADPEWVRRRQQRIEAQSLAIRTHLAESHMPRLEQYASLGNTLGPMLSAKTSFENVLRDMGHRHKEFANELPDNVAGKSSLALLFPAFLCEVKLDGERIIAHVSKEGKVTLQTRQGVWYSDHYSPVIGPAIRRAVCHNVDVILDGEMVSWDDHKKEAIPFGGNRTVAKNRLEWMRRNGRIDDIDFKLHADDSDKNIMTPGVFSARYKKPARNQDANDPGSVCWLKFVLFDILYIGGPDKNKLFKDSGISLRELAPIVPERDGGGSVINLKLWERKSLLYTLIMPQENEVEIVDTIAIGCDGKHYDGFDFFFPKDGKAPEASKHCFDCASTETNWRELDVSRRSNRSDEEIEQERAMGVEHFYSEIVEQQAQEGLVFKDLASPYVLGEASREMNYWRKLKADYENLGHASDIDIVVLGAFFGTGMGPAGLLNHFLVGCQEQQPDGNIKYLTLGKVSGGSVSRKQLDMLHQRTGFQRKTETDDVHYGSWFKEDKKSLPDFISLSSFQRSPMGDKLGWTFNLAKNYPDLFIHPNDSFVLTLLGSEIVPSEEYSAGVTLRFPRIRNIRLDKLVTEVETISSLHEIYRERQIQLQNATQSDPISQTCTDQMKIASGSRSRRFLTANQKKKLAQKGRRVQRKSKFAPSNAGQSLVRKGITIETRAFVGLNFTVLEGIYEVDEESFDAQAAQYDGYFKDMVKVQNRNDVIDFILTNGGRIELTANNDTDFIIGGRSEDARVENYRKAMIGISNDSLSTRKSYRLLSFESQKGVMKWFFLWEIYFKWQKEGNAFTHDDTKKVGLVTSGNFVKQERPNLYRSILSMKDAFPHLLIPRRHHYLIISPVELNSLSKIEDKYGDNILEDTNAIMLKRAINEVRKYSNEMDRPDSSDARRRYTQRSYTLLEDDELWVLSGRMRTLFAYSLKEDIRNQIDIGKDQAKQQSSVIVYPDLFCDSFGLLREEECRNILPELQSRRLQLVSWNILHCEIAASLPLVKALGATISFHLHDGVTHILCDSKQERSIELMENLLNIDCRLPLRKRLIEIYDEHPGEKFFVSPKWFQQKFDRARRDISE